MSKHIKTIPLSSIERIAIVQGGGRSLAQVKQAEGCGLICNAGFYGGNGKPTYHLKADGKVLARAPWGCWGFAWNNGADIRMEALPADTRLNYIAGVELLSPMVSDTGSIPYDPKGELGGTRGRTAIAHTGDKLLLYCSGDGTKDAATLEEVQGELRRLGAETAIYVDGGGSSQCDFGGGETIRSSRKVYSYLCVWLKEPQKEEDMGKKVCLDPGHGPGCVNGSPDGSYKEHEFAWDMSQRVGAHLERCGVTVVMTRDGTGYPSLTERCGISNRAGADLFVSLHSNASGDGKNWTSPAGYLIYTSAGPETAARNVAARAVLTRVREAGIAARGGGLEHNAEYTVLARTTAPAMIIEHGFHTNREDTALLKTGDYRAKLAEADARGILDFLGLPWVAEKPAGTTDTPAADWAAEAWQKAGDKGVMDGTRPAEGITRQELAVVLDRLGLLD